MAFFYLHATYSATIYKEFAAPGLCLQYTRRASCSCESSHTKAARSVSTRNFMVSNSCRACFCSHFSRRQPLSEAAKATSCRHRAADKSLTCGLCLDTCAPSSSCTADSLRTWSCSALRSALVLASLLSPHITGFVELGTVLFEGRESQRTLIQGLLLLVSLPHQVSDTAFEDVDGFHGGESVGLLRSSDACAATSVLCN